MAELTNVDARIAIYGPDEYFAFVESSDPLGFAPGRKADARFRDILRRRRQSNLKPPDFALWLDCVRASYFVELPWRNEQCVIGNSEQSARRRFQLLELDPRQFRVVLLLMNEASDRGGIASFVRGETHWHRVLLNQQSGYPVVTGLDFDLEAGTRKMTYLKYKATSSKAEIASLENAFSLNFLADENVGESEGLGPSGDEPKPGP